MKRVQTILAEAALLAVVGIGLSACAAPEQESAYYYPDYSYPDYAYPGYPGFTGGFFFEGDFDHGFHDRDRGFHHDGDHHMSQGGFHGGHGGHH
jgi:hypothetical protein